MNGLAKYIYVYVLIITSLFIKGQNHDSLNKLLKTTKHDSIKLRLLVELSEVCDPSDILIYAEPAVKLANELLRKPSNNELKIKILSQKSKAINNIGFVYHNQGEITKALNYYNQSLKTQKEILPNVVSKNEMIGIKKGIASSFNNIGSIYRNQGDIQTALNYYNQAFKIQQEIDDKEGMAYSFINIGTIYNNQGDIPKALEFYDKSLKLREEIGDKQGVATSLNNIGLIYSGQGDIKNALKYHNQSLKLREEIGDKQGISYSLDNIGSIYNFQGDFNKALGNFERALKLREELDDKLGIANSLNNIGQIYGRKDVLKAIDYYAKSLKILQEIDYKEGVAVCLNNLGVMYRSVGYLSLTSGDKNKNYQLARSYAGSSLKISKELGFPEYIRNAEFSLSQLDSIHGDNKGAYEHYKQFIIYRDSLNNESTRKASIKNQLKYEFEKKEAVIKEQQEKERIIANEKDRFQKIVIGSVILGLLLVMIFAVFIFRSLKTTRKQKVIIEEKQKEILDSIHYAKRIQKSLLPTEKYIARHLQHYKD